MKKIQYFCDNHGNFTINYQLTEEIKNEFPCQICGFSSKRVFHNMSVSLDKEPDSVSNAIEIMKYSKNPSNKNKTLF